MSLAIKTEHLSKRYRLGQFSTGTLSRDLERWWSMKRGKGDPFAQLGKEFENSHEVWSLRDISFEIQTGDSVGIIGTNGAGKSTLLKILSRVTSPTYGTVKLKGKVASLLEVGTGFHPELTGRENIYLNGGILGMSKREIRQKFDEIVDFSGVEKFIDTPVKRYSSGMYVRLAFAVAAHLDADILVVDEVLAVGDAAFQKKCIGKMGDMSKTNGRTVLFVSHNMSSIKTLCKNALVLSAGQLKFSGEVDEGINTYLELCRSDTGIESDMPDFDHSVGGLQHIEFLKSGSRQTEFLFGERININMMWEFINKLPARSLSVRIHNIAGEFICGYNTIQDKFEGALDGDGKFELQLAVENGLPPGFYSIDVGTYIRPHTNEFGYKKIMNFEVLDIPVDNGFVPNIKGNPRLYSKSEWVIQKR